MPLRSEGASESTEVAFSRYKRIIGRRMHAINFDRQRVEARLGCKVLNIMNGLGMPQTERVN